MIFNPIGGVTKVDSSHGTETMILNKWWVWVGAAVLICWTLGAHNRLVRLRAQVMQRFLTLESWVLQYPDIVHEAVTAAAMAPAGWRSTIGFDLGTEHWNQLQDSANHAAMALAKMNEHPLDEKSSIEVSAAVNAMLQAWVVLVHPDVFFLSVPEALRQRWHELGVVIAPELMKFNQALMDYNIAIEQFPSNLLARTLKFQAGAVLRLELEPQVQDSAQSPLFAESDVRL